MVLLCLIVLLDIFRYSHSSVKTSISILVKTASLRIYAILVLGLIFLPKVDAQNLATNAITKAAEVRGLSPVEASRAIPVHLRAVVIDEADPPDRALIVADDTGEVYALANSGFVTRFHPKDVLQLTGVTDPGAFAPIVKISGARKVGTSPIPAPRPVTYYQLVSGAMDAQWVSISGVIQQLTPAGTNSDIPLMVLSMEGNPITIRMKGAQDPKLGVDAKVDVRALCFYVFNAKRQPLNPVLTTPNGFPVIVKEPSPTKPFDAPIRSADTLLRFSPEQASGHRIHVRGVVTDCQGSFVWIRDTTAGLRLQMGALVLLRPGDRIDVLGFPKYGTASPMLTGAIYRKLGTVAPPIPLALTNAAVAYDNEDDLVSLEATLTDVTPVMEGLMLSLESDGVTFKAVLKEAGSLIHRPNWQPGSRVRIAGICSVAYDEFRPFTGVLHPQSFQLLLRSPDDLTVLQGPPWWTIQHISYVLILVLLPLLLATCLITFIAHRRLKEQEQQRSMAEAEFAAVLSERNRMAREIHDTLAQGLTAISFQLRLVKKGAVDAGDSLNEQLEQAQKLVSTSLAEARNSIWKMRSQVLETNTLPEALNSILKQMAGNMGCKTDLKVTGRPRPLAPIIENNLLRLGQEAITNAIRHAKAGHIHVQLDFADKELRILVEDDGCGFNMNQQENGSRGFGIIGMTERAAEMQGRVEIQSKPGQGTKISLSVPLAG